MLKNFEQIVWNEVFCRMYSKMEQTKTQMKNRNKNAPLKRILSHFAMAHSCHVELIEQIFEVSVLAESSNLPTSSYEKSYSAHFRTCNFYFHQVQG